MRQAMRDAAQANSDFIGDRRGIVTDGQVEGLASAIGMEGAEIQVRQWVTGQAWNAENIWALRKLAIESATDLHAKMRMAAEADAPDAQVLAYAEARSRHRMIQGVLSGVTAEAGRALRAFRNMTGAAGQEGVSEAALGKTLFQMRQEARLGAQLETPEQVSAFMQDAGKRNFGRMVLEYWINNLISGPATHTTYMVGNMLLALEKIGPETAMAATIGQIRKAMGREGETVRMGEVAAQLRGIGQALAPALKASVESLRTGVTTMLPGETTRMVMPFQPGAQFAAAPMLDEAARASDVMASVFGTARGIRDGLFSSAALLKGGGIEGAPLIGTEYSPLGAIPDIAIKGVTVLPLGSAIRVPSRFIAAIHSFFRSMNYSIEKNALAYRRATTEGLTDTAFDERIGELRAQPTPDIMNAARAEATELTLMGQGAKFTQALSRLTNTEVFGFPILKFIDPFVHISSNIIDQSIIQRTPVGLLSPELRADLMGRNGTIAQDKAQARMLVGTAFAVTVGTLAAEGVVSGSGPSDHREAAMWRLAGNQAHSVRIGDFWYDTHRLGVLGMLFGIGADMYEVSHLANEGEFTKAAAHLQHAFTQNILDESFMRGPADLIRAIEDPGRYGEAYVRNFLSSFVPYSVGLAQVSRAIDPYSREARTVVDAMRQKLPYASMDLLPRYDIWGQPVPNREALGLTGLSAIYMTRANNDPVNQEMLKLGVHPGGVSRKIRNVELSDEQHAEYAQIAGRMAKMRLDIIVRSPDWNTWPAEARFAVLQSVIRQSREAAAGMIMARDPTIPQRAILQKREKMQGHP